MKPLSEPDSYVTSGSHHFATSGLVPQKVYMMHSYSWHSMIFHFSCSQSGHGDDYVQQIPDHLTLQDLQIPDVLLYQPGSVGQERHLSGTVERCAAGSLSPSSTDSRVRKRIFV